MAVKADFGFLLGETGGSIELIEHVVPAGWIKQRCMNNCEAMYFTNVRQGTEPLLFFDRQLLARPLNR